MPTRSNQWLYKISKISIFKIWRNFIEYHCCCCCVPLTKDKEKEDWPGVDLMNFFFFNYGRYALHLYFSYFAIFCLKDHKCLLKFRNICLNPRATNECGCIMWSLAFAVKILELRLINVLALVLILCSCTKWSPQSPLECLHKIWRGIFCDKSEA